MRLTTRTNLAMRTLMVCAVNSGQVLRKSDVAAACNASENHLAQVIHALGRLGYLRTLRGRSGGLQLARAPETVNLGQVFRQFEACLPFTECASATGNTCPLTGCCVLKSALSQAQEAFYAVLDGMTLRDLVAGNGGLHQLLRVA